MVQNLPALWETWVRSLVWEEPWRRAWQPTLVFLPRESPWTEEPGSLQSMGSVKTNSLPHTEALKPMTASSSTLGNDSPV